MNDTNTTIQLFVLLGAIFAGFFALIRYFVNVLEKKDERSERIATAFAESVNEMHKRLDTIADFEERVLRAIDANTRVIEANSVVLSKVDRRMPKPE